MKYLPYMSASSLLFNGSNLVVEGYLVDNSSDEEDGEIFDDMDMWVPIAKDY